VVGDAVMGSYDGQRAAAHVRAFAAKAEWALGMIIFRVVLPAVVSNSSTRLDDIAGGRAVGIRAPFGGSVEINPGHISANQRSQIAHCFYLIALCPYHSIAVDTA
jgi:hypothetical protein